MNPPSPQHTSAVRRIIAADSFIALLGGLIFLGIFAWAYSDIPTDYYETRDDGVITMSHARNWVDYGTIGVNPSGPRIEGFSAPFQFFFFAAGYKLFGWGYQTYAAIQTILFTFLLGVIYSYFFRGNPLLSLFLTACSAFLLARLTSFMEWHGSGLENPITHVLFLAAVYLLHRFLLYRKVDYLLTVPVFFATISRLDTVYHIAPLLVLFTIYWFAVHRNPQALWFSLLVLLLWAGFQIWRYSYFGDFYPNTAYAQAISLADRAQKLLSWDGRYLALGLTFSRKIFSSHGGYVLLALMPLLLLARRDRRSVFFFLVIVTAIGSVLLHPLVFGKTSLDPTRAATHLALLVPLVAGFAVIHRRKTRYLLLALLCLLPLAGLAHRAHRVEPYNLCCRLDEFDSVRREMQAVAVSEELHRPTIANPDLGIVSWHKQFNVVDLGFLGNQVLARFRHGPVLAEYIFEYAAPDIIECHDAWSYRYHNAIFRDDRFRERYTPVRESIVEWGRAPVLKVPVGIWLRKDVRSESNSAERRLIDDLQRSVSIDRIAAELDACARDTSRDNSYVARCAYRCLPEFVERGEVGEILAMFEAHNMNPFDLFLITGRSDGKAYRAVVDFVADRCLEKHLGDNWQSRGPAIRSAFDVYIAESSVIYIKEGCSQEDLEARVFLHATPSDSSGVYRKDDFSIREAGYQIGNRCF